MTEQNAKNHYYCGIPFTFTINQPIKINEIRLTDESLDVIPRLDRGIQIYLKRNKAQSANIQTQTSFLYYDIIQKDIIPH